MFDVIVHDQNLLIIFCLQGVCRLLTVAPHKIITNLWLAYTVFDALMHYGIASKLAHVLFFDACVKSHAFLRMRSERSYWITCVAFIFFDACVNRMRLFAAKKSQRILFECTLKPDQIRPWNGWKLACYQILCYSVLKVLYCTVKTDAINKL